MYSKDVDDVLIDLNSNINGLTEEEANERLKKYGKNLLTEKKEKNLIIKFLKQFKDIMVIILLIVALLLYIYGRLYSHEYTDAIVILVVVLINATVGFIQEEKATSVIKGLKKYETSTCKVKRNGKIVEEKIEIK